MAGPIITKIKSWLFPETPKPITPEPAPAPEPVQPEPPAVEPSNLQFINYIRALMILRDTPLKKLREEFLKLPLSRLAWGAGCVIWLYMSYAFLKWFILRVVLGQF
jgi:hypothetical protein